MAEMATVAMLVEPGKFEFRETGLQGTDAEKTARNHVRRSRTPRMIPVLIRLERVVPGLHRHRRAFPYQEELSSY